MEITCRNATDSTLQGERWLSRSQAAEYLAISERTVTSWMAKRRIPFVKIGKTVRFDKKALDKAMEQYTRPILGV